MIGLTGSTASKVSIVKKVTFNFLFVQKIHSMKFQNYLKSNATEHKNK